MYFCEIMPSGNITCLCISNKGNFIITEKGIGTGIYEVIKNPMASDDAHDICTQEDIQLAKMMLEMQLTKKPVPEVCAVGSEHEIMKELKNANEVQQSFLLIKQTRARNNSETRAVKENEKEN